MWNITCYGPVVTVNWPKVMRNLSKFRCRPRSKVGIMWKRTISTIFWISNKACIFVCGDMKNHTRSCSGHDTMIINIGQAFKFCCFQFGPNSTLSEDPGWHNGHKRTDIAEFGVIPTKFWLIMAQIYREVARMNQDFAIIGSNSARSSSLCPLRHCLFPERLQNWAFWGYSKWNLKGCSLFSGIEPWHAPLTRVIFHISKDKYSGFITDVMHCRNCASLLNRYNITIC